MTNPFKPSGQHRGGSLTPLNDEGASGPVEPAPTSVRIMSAIVLGAVAVGSLVVIGYSAIIKGDEASIALLGSTLTGAIGALIVLAGGKDH